MLKEIEKYKKDGLVAVLYSPEFGAGWYSWNEHQPELLFHPKLVQWVLDGKKDQVNAVLKEIGLPENIYVGGAKDLKIKWLEEGTLFMIEENDGYESVIIKDDIDFLIA